MTAGNIPEKLNYIIETKTVIKDKIAKTNQDTNVPFRDYTNLIRNIPNTGAMSYDDIDRLTRIAIGISGEKA